MKVKTLLAVATTSVVMGLWGASVSADIIFTLGNNPQPDEDNILFSASETGTTIVGEVDHSGVAVDFTSTTGQTLYQNAQGQASITTDNGDPLTSMLVTVPGYTFGDFILNLQNGTGTATVTVVDNFNATFTYALGNGQNYLTITTANDINGNPETISSVSVTFAGAGGFDVFKQPRISQVCNGTECVIPPQSVPEPGILGLIALGLLSLAVFRRKAQ